MPDETAAVIARLYGEALFELPADLYIPPEALEVFLEAFEGPLDLLLYLIRKQNLNILDIPVARLTEQYLRYIDQIRTHRLELAAEYLLMAAMLVEIKSRMLLPTIKNNDSQEPEDPRAELVRRLLEYERIKLAAGKLEHLPLLGSDFLVPCLPVTGELAPVYPVVLPDELRQAFLDVLRRSNLRANHTVGKQGLSVREHMSLILKRLQNAQFVEFHELFDVGKGVAVVIVYFLALLELAKDDLLDITQAEPFAPIYIRLANRPA
ncbi:MAG: segregation/condensation protein A [Burkholderiaceae bacterium]|nr:segregation/condensation protein A [Burkholderiaceae bacterium]